MKAFKKGDDITHFQYGLGVVAEPNDEHTHIDFHLQGMKKFVTTIMVVEHARGTPTARRKRTRKKAAVITLKPEGSK
jgi:hypothetical protein